MTALALSAALGRPAAGARPGGGEADRPFPELLRHHRIRAGLTQRALADLSTVSPRAIRDLEAGRANARTQTIHLLADGLRLHGMMRELFVRASLSRRRTSPFDDGAVMAAPRPVDALLGRDVELGALVDVLASGRRRTVALSGLAGVGKTRLAADIAARLSARHGWPVLWAGRDPRAADAGTAGPLARSLRALVEADNPDVAPIRQLLGRHEAVLVVDGVARAQTSRAVEDLLAYCPGLRVVGTARTPVRLAGVPATVVAPLPTPPPGWPTGSALDDLTDVPSVRLLVDRLAEVRPGFVLTRADAGAAAEICRRLDGLPLALEIVAGRGRVLALRQLADLPTADLLDLTLPARAGEAPGTLGGLLRAGLDALQPGHRALLAALARRPRPWTVTDAAAVLRRSPEELLDDLDVLIGHGLLLVVHGASATELRVPHLVRGLLCPADQSGWAPAAG
ncbi:helix-turn-helix domain-containing protein [Krasilnikovia sp. MM14-A1259]|uniref:helix-turn-helix domain-containing protein n=1 Tax=Krasilnikovia sp. MM14-A1259 TaxID=3373539 RepID=UPI003829DBE1